MTTAKQTIRQARDRIDAYEALHTANAQTRGLVMLARVVVLCAIALARFERERDPESRPSDEDIG